VLVVLVIYLFLQGLARYTHPIAGRARFASGHVCFLPAVWFLYQYALNVRVGAWPSAWWWMMPLWSSKGTTPH